MERATGFEPAILGLGSRLDVFRYRSSSFADVSNPATKGAEAKEHSMAEAHLSSEPTQQVPALRECP